MKNVRATKKIETDSSKDKNILANKNLRGSHTTKLLTLDEARIYSRKMIAKLSKI